jgi:hypothetical protein
VASRATASRKATTTSHITTSCPHPSPSRQWVPSRAISDPGCKTVDDPTKNNPTFTETQRGNVDAPGTESTCVGANPGQTKQISP